MKAPANVLKPGSSNDEVEEIGLMYKLSPVPMSKLRT
ncbi:MAG: hypothetical protein QOJ64_2381 [Acidobacteriota bacterium]|nr:hypothetical protein [Acidobacteriota bacterium]